MDNARERILAALLGGAGTVVGVLIYQALPDLLRHRFLQFRWPNAVWFLATIFLIGALGGRLGHYLFLNVASGPIEGRAMTVGAAIGFGIALVGWTITSVFREMLFPLEPYEEAQELMGQWLLNALLAGPIGGVLASYLVVRRLRKITGLREPLDS